MIEFTQTISDNDYKKAIAIHYFGYKYTYINPIIGLILLSVTIFNALNKTGTITHNTIFLSILCLFLLIRPLLYIQNVFKSIKSNKLCSNQVNIKITEANKIETNAGGNSSSINLKDLYSYYNTKNYLFLYTARNQYFILDKKDISSDYSARIISILQKLNIKERN